MDKAVFRAKLREAQKREKRIDSPLVRYNENDQPVCRVCAVTLKSESLWPAHQISKKHREAIENVKATAAGLTRENNGCSELPKESQKQRSSSTLPAEFFDTQEVKRQRTGVVIGGQTQPVRLSAGPGLSGSIQRSEEIDLYHMETDEKSESRPYINLGQPSKKIDGADAKEAIPQSFSNLKEQNQDKHFQLLNKSPFDKNTHEGEEVKKVLPDGFFDSKEMSDRKHKQFSEASKGTADAETKQVKGVLPEGFFDNKDADLHARGVKPVKVDINDAYKEFEKEIQVNLQEVDDRLQQEEMDAAEEMEEFHALEQKAYKEMVKEMNKKLSEKKAERLAREDHHPAFMGKDSSDESTSDDSDDDEDDNFAVDWRAKQS